MYAVILHKNGLNSTHLNRGLHYENIETDGKIWMQKKIPPHSILNAHILILYCRSPECEIIELLPQIRQQKYALPIVIFDEIYNKETERKAQQYSADGYFAPPYDYKTLALNLKNIIIKKEEIMHSLRWLHVSNIWLDTQQRLAKRDTCVIPLRNKEFSLLEFFMINRGKILTRNDILEHVWDRNANFASNTVDVHINRLRRKLDDPFKDKLIHTVHCIGYMFGKEKEENYKNKRTSKKRKR